MKEHTFNFSYKEFSDIKELSEKERILIQQAKEAANNAYAPYSNFYVGAAVLLSNGEIITGNNQENAAYPSGLCAERVALFYANALYPHEKIVSIAITAFNKDEEVKNPVSPCGSCRQVILESQFRQKEPISLILAGKQKIYKIDDASLLLPIHFDKDMFL